MKPPLPNPAPAPEPVTPAPPAPAPPATAAAAVAAAFAPPQSEYETPDHNRPRWARAAPGYAPAPTLTSEDGRLTLTDTTLTVQGGSYPLLALERADLTPVKWLLYYLLGGIGLAFIIIAYLQNWLRTMPFAGGLLFTSLLLLYGWRGTNRLRLYRPGRDVLNFALPGETAPWQRLCGELNRRIFRAHDRAAAGAAALLAAADEATRQAAAAAQAADLPLPAPNFTESAGD